MLRFGNLLVMAASAMISGILFNQSMASAGPPTAAPSQQGGHMLAPDQRAHCIAQGGHVGIAGLSGDEMCALPFRDAGRSCTDRAQCAGLCLAPDSPSEGKPPATVVGHCQAFNYPFGCHVTVEHGQMTGELCTD
jgi:hypothetical protein